MVPLDVMHECGPFLMTGSLPTSLGLPALETCRLSAGTASPPTCEGVPGLRRSSTICVAVGA